MLESAAGAARCLMLGAVSAAPDLRRSFPQHSAAAGSLWSEGTGWGFVPAAPVLIVLAQRARARHGFSWAGLWVGVLAVLNAIAMAADSTFQPGEGAGMYALGVGGVLVLAGWALSLWRRPADDRRRRRPLRAGAGARALRARSGLPKDGRAPGAAVRSPLCGRSACTGCSRSSSGALRCWGTSTDADRRQRHRPGPIHVVLQLVAACRCSTARTRFSTKALLAPDGYNRGWRPPSRLRVSSAAPITELFGAVVTYNVLALAAPAVGRMDGLPPVPPSHRTEQRPSLGRRIRVWILGRTCCACCRAHQTSSSSRSCRLLALLVIRQRGGLD